MNMQGRLISAAVVAATLVAATPAGAAVATTVVSCQGTEKGCSDVTYAEYEAAPGEANEIVIRRRPYAYTISDSVPIEARKQCKQVTATQVTCPGATLSVHLADGNDSGNAGAGLRRVSLYGKAGDDTLFAPDAVLDGGDGDDHLAGNMVDGGAGRDVISGTDGNDFLNGGDDEDEIHAGAGDDGAAGGSDGTADVIDGGTGVDSISYSGRSDPVEVNIADQTGGYPGEGDQLSGFENAYGGLGADHLVGDEGPNLLDGGGDNSYEPHSGPGDVIVGAGGPDRLTGGANSGELYGGEGDDELNAGTGGGVLDGGPGDDRLSLDQSSSGGLDSVVCGAGRDGLSHPGATPVPDDCEIVLGEQIDTPAHPRRVGDREAVLPVHCPLPRPRCRGEVTLRLPGERRPFAVSRFKRRHGRANVHLILPERIATSTSAPLRVRVKVAVEQKGYSYPVSWMIDLSVVPFEVRK